LFTLQVRLGSETPYIDLSYQVVITGHFPTPLTLSKESNDLNGFSFNISISPDRTTFNGNYMDEAGVTFDWNGTVKPAPPPPVQPPSSPPGPVPTEEELQTLGIMAFLEITSMQEFVNPANPSDKTIVDHAQELANKSFVRILLEGVEEKWRKMFYPNMADLSDGERKVRDLSADLISVALNGSPLDPE